MGLLKVSEPLLRGNEKAYLCQAIDEGEVSSQGRFVRLFEEAFAKWAGTKYAIAVCNGTAALETGLYGMDLKLKSIIAVPNNTIISCFFAAMRAGLRPSPYETTDPFMEITEENVMRCHLFGTFTEAIAFRAIDDCSQYWKPFQPQEVACYSLYANKIITSGEGGIITTNKKEIYERCKKYRNLCHAGQRFIHDDYGYNFRMSNLQAAVALAQLEQIDKFVEKKRLMASWYVNNLPDNAIPMFGMDVPWMYLIKTPKDAGMMVSKLYNRDIECRRYFFPCHRQPFLLTSNRIIMDKPYPHNLFPYSNEMWDHAFYLPSGLTLTERDIIYVCRNLREIL